MLIISPTHHTVELTTRLLQEYATRQRDPQPSRVSSPRPPTPRPPKKHTNDVRKTANPASALSAQGRRNPRPQPAKLTAIPQLKTIPKPHCKDRTPLDLAMGLRNRFDTYIRIRVQLPFPPLPHADIYPNGFLRTGFRKSSSAPGSIGRRLGRGFRRETRPCSTRWCGCVSSGWKARY